jgi:hypothetical protein
MAVPADRIGMQIATGVLLAIFLLTSLAVGVRLVVLHRRTRRLPELLIGVSILGIGPVGMCGILLAAGLTQLASPAAPYVGAISVASIVAGFTSAGLFNWRVYRPDSRAAARAVAVGVLIAGVGFGLELGTTAFADPLHPGVGVSVVSSLCAATLLWGAFESVRYWLLMRRRLALGLADPVVTNRFLLYGLGIGSAGFGSALSISAQLFFGLGMSEMPVLMFSNSVFGLFAAIFMWVAFLPPAAWRRYVAGSAS